MPSCSAAGPPASSAFQIWHNLQVKPTAFVALMAKSQRMNCIPHFPARGETDFVLQISGFSLHVPSCTLSEAYCQWIRGLLPSLLWSGQCA